MEVHDPALVEDLEIHQNQGEDVVFGIIDWILVENFVPVTNVKEVDVLDLSVDQIKKKETVTKSKEGGDSINAKDFYMKKGNEDTVFQIKKVFHNQAINIRKVII